MRYTTPLQTILQTVPALYRRVAGFLVVLWLLPLFTPLNLSRPSQRQDSPSELAAFLAASRQEEASPEASADLAHQRVCRCANCRRHNSCCCLAGKTPRERLVIRAVCDTDTSSFIGVAAVKAVPPAASLIRSTLIVDGVSAARLPAEDTTAPTRFPDPLLLPPRRLS